jgi:hypothetical protein
MKAARVLSPKTNPAGLMSAGMAILAAVLAVVNAFRDHGVIDTQVIIAAVGAVAALATRQVVTPVADPKGKSGTPLYPSLTRKEPS